MPRRVFKTYTLFSAKAATGFSNAIPTDEYRHWTLTVGAPVNSSLTFKLQGISLDAAPDFSAARSSTNIWEYIALYDLQDGSFIAGDTGVTINNDTAANNCHVYSINTDDISFLSLELSAYTDGSLTAYLTGAND